MMRKFLQTVSTWLLKAWRSSSEDELFPAVLDMAAQFDRNQFNCDQVYELLDQYAERAARGEDVLAELRLVNPFGYLPRLLRRICNA